MNPSMGGSGATSLLLTVLIATTTHQHLPTAAHICLKPLLYALPAKPRGCGVLLQERARQGCRARIAHGWVHERLLKQDTTRPWRPH